MKYTITNTTTTDGLVKVEYTDNTTAIFDSEGRLLEWVNKCEFKSLTLTSEEAKHTYEMFITFWDTHEDHLQRQHEDHHEVPLFALKSKLGVNSTTAIRGGENDRGRLVSLPVLAHMRAHFFLMLVFNGTENLEDARTAFNLLTGRQGTTISDLAKIELYDMKQVAKGLTNGTSNMTITYPKTTWIKHTREVFKKDYSGTDFHGCIFDHCVFDGACFDCCDLTFTLFRDCRFKTDVSVECADLRGIRVDGRANFYISEHKIKVSQIERLIDELMEEGFSYETAKEMLPINIDLNN